MSTVLLIVIPNLFMLGLGAWVLLHNLNSRINTSFFAVVTSLFIWSIPHVAMHIYPISEVEHVFWVNMNFIGPSAFLSFFVYFSYVFPEDKARISWLKVGIMSISPIVLIPLAFSGKIMSYLPNGEPYFHMEIGFYIFYVLVTSFVLWVILNFYHKMKISSGESRRAISTIFVAILSAVTVGLVFGAFFPVVLQNERLLFLGPAFTGLILTSISSYAIVRYGLMDIRVIAKRALLYATVITVGTLFFGSVVLISDAMEENFPSLSFWFVPIAFSCAGLILGIYIWKVLSESEAIKYEFITTVTHKFRTPLSRIIWALEGIKEEGGLTDFQQSGLRSIDYSTRSILKMVDLMTHLSDERTSSTKKELNLSETLKATLNDTEAEFTRKNISLERDIEENITVFAEKSGLRFVVNALLENALTYTPSGGVVNVDLYIEDGKAVIRVKDTGIGMSKSTQESVSKSFFRGKEARTKDTEGMGVGLYVSRSIVDEIDGEIDFHSDGIGEGSTFFVRLPVEGVQEEKERSIPNLFLVEEH
ncbi:MAG: ATP-binding protein [Patescibacteria group bacterium]